MKGRDGKRVIVAGGSGLVGSCLVGSLVDDPRVERVILLARRPLDYSAGKISEVVDDCLDADNALFDRYGRCDAGVKRLSSHSVLKDACKNNDAVEVHGVICLGTTIKSAGSEKAFRDVDLHLVTHVARVMLEVGVKDIAVMSSLGASDTSYSHYLLVKGVMEKQLLAMGFETVTFIRSGPITGKRKKVRWSEVLLQSFLGLFGVVMFGKLSNFKPIKAAKIGQYLHARMFLPSNERVGVARNYDIDKLFREQVR